MTFQKDNENYASMNLQTIPNIRRTYFNNRQNCMDVTDIEGARCRYLQKPRHIRQVYNNRNDDIQKSNSSILIPKSVNKADRQLMVDDIQGTRTKVNKFSTTRKTNPLQPAYQLPVVQYAPFQEPKFIRDNMAIDDIEGTRTKETFAIKLQRSGKVLEKDNSLLKQKQKFIPKKDNYLLDVSDINKVQKPNHGQRCTNPLEPVYKVAVSKDNPTLKQVGFIQGSKAVPPKQRRTHTNFTLNVHDIPGTAPKITKQIPSSKNQLIKQAKAGSYKRGISTKRLTNPLQPQYQYLGISQNKGSNYTKSYSRPKTAAQRLDAFISK